jgi:hypothetical protein
MGKRRKRLSASSADDADVRGDHRYPDEAQPDRSDVLHVGREAVKASAGLTREPGQYAAGAEGTQRITTARSKQ